MKNDYPLSRSLAEESLVIRRELGNRAGVAEALNIVAIIVANETGLRIWGIDEAL